MTPEERELAKQYAGMIAATDAEAWAWMLDLVFTHDGEPERAKAMVVKALRYYANTAHL